MDTVKKIDKSLESSFKDLPHLPDSTRTGLASVLPWLALVGGILQLLGAWGLYELVKRTDRISEAVDSLSIYITGESTALSASDKTFIYVGLILLVVQAAIMLLAFPKLQRKERAGWSLLFLAALVNVLYAVSTIFIDARGFGSFIFALLGTAVAFYLLYEVKSKFAKTA